MAIIATDNTWELREIRGERMWVGRCIFCNKALTVSEDGAVTSRATIEHIVPRSHGGDDAIANLALACVSCNNEKGMRHDARRLSDPRRLEIVAALQAKRRERWRESP